MAEKKGGIINLPSCGSMLTRPEESGDAVMVHKGEDVPCNLCGSLNHKEMYTVTKAGVSFRVVRCQECQLAFISPRIPPEEINKMYESQDTIKFGFPISACGPLARNSLWHNSRFDIMEEYFKKLNPHVKTIKYLDAGCGFGNTVEFSTKRGWDAVGIDISTHAVQEAQRLGRNVIKTTLDKSDFEENSFDIILMSEVIEHFNDPMYELKQAYRFLKPNGLIVVDTINIDSVFMKLLGENSSMLIAGHITYFNYQTLGQMIEKAGFKLIKGFRGLELGVGDYFKIYSAFKTVREFY